MTDLATMYQDLPRLSKILLYIYVGQLLIGRYIWTQLFYYMINEYTLLFRHFQVLLYIYISNILNFIINIAMENCNTNCFNWS